MIQLDHGHTITFKIVEYLFDDLDTSVQKKIDEMLDFDDENAGDSMYDGLF
jgi:hypothetical protein